jgi:hypothetical protein
VSQSRTGGDGANAAIELNNKKNALTKESFRAYVQNVEKQRKVSIE